MDTKSWGPHGWFFLHIITFNYPDNPTTSDMIHYKQLFENFKFTLPCKFCRDSYCKFLHELPIDNHLDSRESLAYWFYQIHNKVNNKLRYQYQVGISDKPISDNPSFFQVCQFYEQFRASCSNSKMTCSRFN